MPPPDPRSSTVSPGLSWASAVGLPQPSDALTASSGRMLVCDWSYKSLVMGSISAPQQAVAPQHELPCPAVTRRAASPYFSFTTSLMSGVLMSGVLIFFLLADFIHHHAFRMGRQQQPHDPQPWFGPHGGKHVSVSGNAFYFNERHCFFHISTLIEI